MHRARTWSSLAVALLILLLGPGWASAAPAPSSAALPELTSACALKSNGLLRMASSRGDCKKNEKFVSFKPGPVLVCAQPSGSVRTVKSLRDCRPPAMRLTLPPTSGVVYFCVTTSTGAIRWVADPGECVAGETAYGVTPNDDAPSVVSTTPATGATQVATDQTISFNWSEAVTATAAAITAVCDGTDRAGTVGGSGTTTLTFAFSSALPQGVSCTVTAHATLIGDVDALDPPDQPAADAVVTFTTDRAPAVDSITPADGAVDVAADADLTVTFTEPVTLDAGAVDLLCGNFTHPAITVTGGGTATITVDPGADLAPGITCTVSVDLSKVHDVDAGDPPDTGTGSASSTFTTADTAPTLVSISPADGATHVASDANIVLTFSEPVSVPDASTFSLACPSDGAARGFILSALSGTTLTVDPVTPLPQGLACRFTGDASSITDVDTVDPPDALSADIDVSFTVDAAPVVVSTLPVDGAADVLLGSTLQVTFSEPVNAAGGAFTLSCTASGAGGSVAYLLAMSGDGTDTITLTPGSDLEASATCSLGIRAASITDVDGGDPPDNPSSDTTVTFTTPDPAPAVSSTIPTDGSTGIGRGTTIGISFTEPVTFDSGAFTLACPTGTPVAFDVSSGGSSATLTPVAALPADTTCTVTVAADKIHDADVVDPPDSMTGGYSFSFTTSANSAPTDLALSPSSVAENAAIGTTVGAFTSTDPDPGDTFTYALVTGTGDTDNASFAISGDQLRSAAVFDHEARSSYSIRVRSTDSGGQTVDKAFTITVTDVNEAPTDITLSSSSIAENQPSGTTIGTLGALDPETGQTFTFTLEAGGCGGAANDNGSFQVTGSTLKSAAVFDVETKSSYAVCVRATDNGSPTESFDELLTVTVSNVNEAPTAQGHSYTGAVGNTLAVLAPATATGPKTTLAGVLLGVGATDPEGATVSVVAETVATTGGGTATISADGSFTYLPGVGDKAQSDTFTFHVTDGTMPAAGTATVTIGNDIIWYVDNTAAAGGDGRSTSRFSSLTPVNGAGGSGDADASGDVLFLFAGSGSYAGGLVLEPNQIVLGEKAGLSVNGKTAFPAGSTAPVITNAAGSGLTLANGVLVDGVSISNAWVHGITGVNLTSASVGESVAVPVSGSRGHGVNLEGGSGTITLNTPVSSSSTRSVVVSGRTGGTVSLTGSISGQGIELSGNTGATVAFSGGLSVSTTTAAAFSATGGGTVTVTGAANTLASTTGTALDVANTTIGASGLTFRSISANGAVNGIRLLNTGSTAGLSVTGSGSTTRGGNASGGTIQNTSGPGVSISGSKNVSLNNLTISGTPNSSGILGTAVDGFSFTNGTVTNSGLTSKGTTDSNIAFTSAATANVTGAVTVANSSLTNAYQHGIHVQNRSGTISLLHLDSNTITSTASATTSAGNGIFLQVNGAAGSAASVTAGTVSGNTVTGFPSGSGISMLTGNEQAAAAPAVTFGTGAGDSAVRVTGNLVNGFGTGGSGSATPRMNAQCILFTMAGQGTAFVDVTNNGTTSQPLGLNAGTCISINSLGAASVTSQITGNVVKPQAQVSGTFGIAGGADRQVYGDGTLDSAVLRANVANNTVSSTTGNGIFFVANGSGTGNLKVQNNNVAAPTDVSFRPGIRVDSGTSGGTATNTTICLTITGNTAAGASDGTSLSPGIGLRKQGTVATTNVYGITGLSPNPATNTQTETYVSSLNPGSASGGSGTGGTLVFSGNNFVSCTMPAF